MFDGVAGSDGSDGVILDGGLMYLMINRFGETYAEDGVSGGG